jgi:NACalpha-BTF3-like transcription factor
MDELINLVVQRTGISQEDARKAVEVEAGELLKGRLGTILGGKT